MRRLAIAASLFVMAVPAFAQTGIGMLPPLSIPAGDGVLPGPVPHKQYFRLMDPNHVHQSAAVLVDPNGNQPNVAVTDIAIFTHSTEDGSIIPASWQAYVPPENWSPLELGGGGSAKVYAGHLSGSAVLHIGSSVNLAPQLGALFLAKVDKTSAPALQAVKNAMLGVGGSGVRLGGGLGGTVVKDGVFQSVKEAFPGQGVVDIVKKSGRLTVGYSWVW